MKSTTRRPRRQRYSAIPYIAGTPINADTLLAAARQHDRYLRTVPPRDYQMRVFENGSVWLRNIHSPNVQRWLSLQEIQQWAALNFGWGPQRRKHRPLWREVLGMWI